MSDYNSLCCKVSWNEQVCDECKDCSDHDVGICLMPEAYQQGRADAIDEMVKNVLCHYTERERENKLIDFASNIKQVVVDIAEQMKEQSN